MLPYLTASERRDAPAWQITNEREARRTGLPIIRHAGQTSTSDDAGDDASSADSPETNSWIAQGLNLPTC